MTTNENNENGWDSLADELGVQSTKPSTDREPAHAPPAREAPRPKSIQPARQQAPEVEEESDDFGLGLAEEAEPMAGALFDPGPDAVAEDEEFDDSAPEPMEDDDELSEESAEATDGGKRRRRRRRRKKKGGAPEPAAASAAADEDDIVEEGEAPGEVEDDDDELAGPVSAVDEEMDDEVPRPAPEWHVMTWLELVSKLHRPG